MPNRALVIAVIDPTDLRERGFARLALRRYSEALSDFEDELQVDLQLPDAWFGKALALIGLGRLDEAVEALDMATSLDPDFVDAIEAKQALEQAP